MVKTIHRTISLHPFNSRVDGFASLPLGSALAKGFVKNYNTIEDFKAADKSKLFNEAADKVFLIHFTLSDL